MSGQTEVCPAWKNRLKTKRTEIAIEFEEIIHLAGHEHGLARAWCATCARPVPMVTPQQAAVIARVSVRAVNRSVETGDIHFIETRDGFLLVCLNSVRDDQGSLKRS